MKKISIVLFSSVVLLTTGLVSGLAVAGDHDDGIYINQVPDRYYQDNYVKDALQDAADSAERRAEMYEEAEINNRVPCYSCDDDDSHLFPWNNEKKDDDLW